MRKRGQSTIEFTFVIIAFFLLAYGLIQIFRWAGMDLAERRWTFEKSLTESPDPNEQLKTDFYRPKPLSAVFQGWK